MGAEERDGDDAAAAAGDARGRQRNVHGKTKMTPTSLVTAPPDAKERRIHLGDSVGQRGAGGQGRAGGGTERGEADEASERHVSASDGDQRDQTTGERAGWAGSTIRHRRRRRTDSQTVRRGG